MEAFDLIGADGETRTCSRSRKAELFRLAIGGYGLFGVISRVELRLRPRRQGPPRRGSPIPSISSNGSNERIRDGYLYGDYQFATDAIRDSFLGRGVFSCYQPVHRTLHSPKSDPVQPRGLGQVDVLFARPQAAGLRTYSRRTRNLGSDLLGRLTVFGGLRR